MRRTGTPELIWIKFCMVVDSAGLMPTEARGNYLPEAPYLRETKTYLNCNSCMQCMGTSNMFNYH